MPKAPEIMPLETGFDYGALPVEIRTEVKIVADEIKRCMRGAVIEVGAALARIKDRLRHGQFGEWLVAEFGMTERTAQNYMSAAALAAKYETVSVLPAASLYLLAAPSTPEPARNAVIDRLGRGEAPSAKAIKALIADAKYQEQEEQRRRGRRTSPPSKPARISEISNGSTMTDTAGRQQSSARPPNAPSKEAQIGAMRESLAIAPTRPISQLGQAYYEARDQERDKAADELVQVFRSDPSRISHIPIAQRVALANNCLKLLDIGIDDLQPKIGDTASLTGTVKAPGAGAAPCDWSAVPEAIEAARSPPGGPHASDAPRDPQSALGEAEPALISPVVHSSAEASSTLLRTLNTIEASVDSGSADDAANRTSAKKVEPLSPDDAGLFAIWSNLKPNTQKYGRPWIADGCPKEFHPEEHHRITESLKPFRIAARSASAAQRERFLELSWSYEVVS